jgi:hypothetical protein
MSQVTITDRTTKGSALTIAEMDANLKAGWNHKKLDADFTNATTTQTTITDGTTAWSWTPPASSDIEIECELLVQATATANLPLLRYVVPSDSLQFGWGEISWFSTATAKSYVTSAISGGGQTTTMAAGAAQSVLPVRYSVYIKMRTGTTPGAILIQGAGESAAALAITVKRGSVMRYRVVN